MNNNAQVEKTLNGYNDFRHSFKKEALETAIYSESFLNKDGLSEKRRPIVLIKSEEDSKHWRSQLETWNVYTSALHRGAPAHFPKTSSILRAPEIRSDVVSVVIYKNSATTSALIDPKKLINRLKRIIKQYSMGYSSVYSAEKEALYERYTRDLAFFESIQDEKLRLRNEGHYEILAFVTFKNGDEEKVRVNEQGLIIEPANINEPVKVTLPSLSTADKRSSAYDNLEPIDTILPFAGKLYFEKSVVAAKNKMAKKGALREI